MITFTEKPTAEQCQTLRGAGFGYDRRNAVWFTQPPTLLFSKEAIDKVLWACYRITGAIAISP
jgi:hypothetical protein